MLEMERKRKEKMSSPRELSVYNNPLLKEFHEKEANYKKYIREKQELKQKVFNLNKW